MALLKSPEYYADKHKDFYMTAAKNFAELSNAKRAKVGSVIYLNNHTLTFGHNGQPSGWDTEVCEHNPLGLEGFSVTCPTVANSEFNAIDKVTDKELLKGAILFVTLCPCLSCAELLIESGISRVYYSEEYRDDSGIKLLVKSGVIVTNLK